MFYNSFGIKTLKNSNYKESYKESDKDDNLTNLKTTLKSNNDE